MNPVEGIAILVLGAFFGWMWIREQNAKAKAAAYAQERYFEALEKLAADPNNSALRIECLKKGRAHYAFLLPNTHTVHLRNGIPVGTSNHQDNTAGREARIAADIAARTTKAA